MFAGILLGRRLSQKRYAREIRTVGTDRPFSDRRESTDGDPGGCSEAQGTQPTGRSSRQGGGSAREDRRQIGLSLGTKKSSSASSCEEEGGEPDCLRGQCLIEEKTIATTER